MMLRILFFMLFVFYGDLINGQSTQWYLEATIGLELSYYESPFNLKEDNFRIGLGKDNSSGFNYQIGGIIGRPINRFVSFESGLHLLIREDKNIDRTFACSMLEGSRRCAGLSPSIQKKRYHILEIPLRIKLQQNISKNHKAYWAGAYSNYIYYATIYDKGSHESISNRKYYAFSLNTNIG